MSMNGQGYGSKQYCQTLSAYGDSLYLPNSQGYLLKRPVPDQPYFDAINPYPLYTCHHWDRLYKDLKEQEAELVSISLVTDPFGHFQLQQLKSFFRDKFLLFKQHFIIDLKQHPEQFISSHHRRNARKGLKQCQIEKIDQPLHYLEDWQKCLNILIKKHDLQGLNAYHNVCFKTLFEMPEVLIFRAFNATENLGFLIWVCQGNKAYYHLAAYYPSGYEQFASFALFKTSIEYFKVHGFEYLNLGAGAGLNNEESGLTRFKKGWSTDTKPVYFCGKICNPERYWQLSQQKKSDYFPVYRA